MSIRISVTLTPVIILPIWDGGGLPPLVPDALKAVPGPGARIAVDLEPFILENVLPCAPAPAISLGMLRNVLYIPKVC